MRLEAAAMLAACACDSCLPINAFRIFSMTSGGRFLPISGLVLPSLMKAIRAFVSADMGPLGFRFRPTCPAACTALRSAECFIPFSDSEIFRRCSALLGRDIPVICNEICARLSGENTTPAARLLPIILALCSGGFFLPRVVAESFAIASGDHLRPTALAAIFAFVSSDSFHPNELAATCVTLYSGLRAPMASCSYRIKFFLSQITRRLNVKTSIPCLFHAC